MTRKHATAHTTGDLCDWLGNTCEALRAFEIMLSPFLREYSNADDYSYGIAQLLLQQIEDLQEVRGHIRDHMKGMEARLDQLSARSGLPEGWVTPPIYRTGMENDLRAKVAAHEGVDKLRRADLEAVARDTNLAEATVRRVVDRLLAEPDAAPDAAISNG